MNFRPRPGVPLTPILRSLRGLLLVAALAVPTTVALPTFAKPKVHVVYKGQRLGSIAKRYNVGIDELCKANGITRRDPIHPGQKLVIPGTDDGKSSAKSTDKSASKGDSTPPRPAGKAQIHVVAKGHTLSAIAGRYAITVTALCNANGIEKNATLTVGQKLIIPHKTDKDGAYARRQRLNGHFDDDEKDEKSSEPEKTKSWEPYVKPAWRRGYIKIRRYGRYWAGYVIGPNREVLGHASNKINFVLGAAEDGPRIDPQLIRLIASISDKFGGREMRIVSGYRTKSFVAASKHKEGRALDFSIPGVPNEALRDYLRTINDVGVGYYPNSSFVHLDVRGYNSYWVDYAGPGEAPQTRRHASKKGGSSSNRDKADGAAEDEEDFEGQGDSGGQGDGEGHADSSHDGEGHEDHGHDAPPAEDNDSPKGDTPASKGKTKAASKAGENTSNKDGAPSSTKDGQAARKGAAPKN